MDKRLTVYTDGGARGNPGPSAAGFVVISEGKIIYTGSQYLGIGTNNQAEYKAVLLALEWLLKNQDIISDKTVEFFLDSELVTNQLTGKYKIKDRTLKSMAIKAKEMERSMVTLMSFTAIRREKNKLADRLVNEALDTQKNYK